MSYVRTTGKPTHLSVPYNGKIADITHADTIQHFLVLANATGTGAIAGETRKIVAVGLWAARIAGTGYLAAYPNEGVQALDLYSYDCWTNNIVIIKDGTQRLQYRLNVANDDYDLYCLGYVVEA